jgi:predicted nucleotidyltransferase
MDLSAPTKSVTSTLDGPLLAVLAAVGRPLTVGQVAEEAARGSEIGIRRSLARLVEQGLVRATLMGRNQVHELNRDHVAADAAVLLANLRTRLWDKFRSEFETWKVRPLYAAAFGSAAREDGDESSDIDVFLVHPPLRGERKPSRTNATLGSQIADALGAFAVAKDDAGASRQWEEQLDSLRESAERWTGNPLQIVDLSFREWRHLVPSHHALLEEVRKDGIELYRIGVMDCGRQARQQFARREAVPVAVI